MKILLADDHIMFREGCRYLLQRLADKVWVLEAGSLTETLALLELHPDISLLLLDLKMPGMKMLESYQQIQARLGDLPVVILSASDDSREVREYLEAGVRGYIHKSDTSEAMLGGLRQVLAGEKYISRELRNYLQEHHASPLLSHRQREILRRVAEGKTNKLIARELNIAENTVKSHLQTLMRQLGAHTRLEAVLKARESGEPV